MDPGEKEPMLANEAATFKDSKGRSWRVELNLASIRLVKERLGINLLKLSDNKFAGFDELASDRERVMDVVHVLCEAQFKGNGLDTGDKKLDDFEFESAIDGPAMAAGPEAFVRAYINFFPDPKIRAALQSLYERGGKAAEILLAEMETALAQATPEWMAARLKEKFGISPASSANTPIPSVTGSST